MSPTVAWTDASAGREDVYLRTWTGTEWVGLGGSGAPGGVTQGSGEPAAGSFTCAGGVALGGDSRPWLLWQHAQPNDGLVAYLRHWTGAGWEELGGSASGGGLVLAATQSWWPALALGPSSRPAVALENAGAIYFITWTGTQWSGLGGSDVAPGISSQAPGIRARLALDGAGTPTVVWTTGSAGQEAVHARRWTGTAWELLGPTSAISRPGVPSVDPVVGVDSSGAPVAVWTELPSVGRGEVLARRWDGAAWNTLGPGTLTEAGLAGATTRSAALAFRRGALVVAWEQEVAAQTDVHCAQWDGTRWSVLDPGPGGVSNSGRARWPSLAADSAGALYLSWEEQRSPSVAEVYLRVLAP